MEILLVEVAGERCALPVARVRRIVRAAAVARLAGAPPVVDGVLNLGGRAVPVLSLRRRFSLPDRPLLPDDVFVVAEVGPRLVALRADAGLAVLELGDDVVEPAAGLVADPGYVHGVAKLPDGVVLIHDLDTFLTEAEATRVNDALAAAEEAA